MGVGRVKEGFLVERVWLGFKEWAGCWYGKMEKMNGNRTPEGKYSRRENVRGLAEGQAKSGPGLETGAGFPAEPRRRQVVRTWGPAEGSALCLGGNREPAKELLKGGLHVHRRGRLFGGALRLLCFSDYLLNPPDWAAYGHESSPHSHTSGWGLAWTWCEVPSEKGTWT